MKTLEDIIATITSFGPSSSATRAAKMRIQVKAVTDLIANATVETKKILVSTVASGWKRHSCLQHKGLWGYPKVFIVHAETSVPVRHQFALAPFNTYTNDRNEFVLTNKPSVPDIFKQISFKESPYTISEIGHQESGELGLWFAENCPRLNDLDRQVRAAWQQQCEDFEAEADRYIDKFSDRQRTNFQQKLAKEIGGNEYELADMSSENLYEIFEFARDHAGALQSLVNFCKRNRADAIFIDKSDVEVALKLAKISHVMKA